MDSLLARAMDGDRDAEQEILRFLSVRFRAFATRRLGADEAEDVVQEACLAVLRKYKTETFTRGFRAWAYGVLKMEIKSHLRIKSHMAERFDSGVETDEVVVPLRKDVDYQLKMRLADCLRIITKRRRSYARVLNLIHQGYKSDEICRRLGIKPNNFYVILSRGRQMMKTCLERGTI